MKNGEMTTEKQRSLPGAYLQRMRAYLGEGFPAFFESYGEAPKKALRFNTKKVRKETIEKLCREWDLKPVPWCKDGYYYDEEKVRPGKSAYHEAGVFYIQEPSAMITAEWADVKEDELVLDLCAAPGGKSSQAAAKAGLLISNEIIPKRARILSSNIERMGFDNVIVVSASPKELSAAMAGLFDKVIVDAPCSGEGMMRRDDIAVSEWSEEQVTLCAVRQKDILREAEKLLRPGGVLVYSTCTFEPSENGEQMREFCKAYPDFSIVRMQQTYPHTEEGEGHFCAVLKKEGEGKAYFAEQAALQEALTTLSNRFKKARLHVLRTGVERGKVIEGKHGGKSRYEPSHAEAMAMRKAAFSGTVNLKTEALSEKYLRGEALMLSYEKEGDYELSAENGFILVLFDGYPLGVGKLVGTIVKNHYPKGLRRN